MNNRLEAEQNLSFVRLRREQRIVGLGASPGPITIDLSAPKGAKGTCATVSPDFVRDAILFLVRQLHGVVATSGALLAAIGMPEPTPSPAAHRTLVRSPP
jgi:hypothetical protein